MLKGLVEGKLTQYLNGPARLSISNFSNVMFNMPNFEFKRSDSIYIHEPLLDDSVLVERNPATSWLPKLWRLIIVPTCVVYMVVSAPMLIILTQNRIPLPYSGSKFVLSLEV